MNAADRIQMQRIETALLVATLQRKRIEDKLDSIITELFKYQKNEISVQFDVPIVPDWYTPDWDKVAEEAALRPAIPVNPDTGEILPAPALTEEGANRLLAARDDTTPTGRRKRVTEVTAAFREAMNTAIYQRTGQTYVVELGSVDEIQHQIDRAVGRKVHLTYHDKQVDVRGWLNRAVEYQKLARGSPDTLEAKRTADRERYLADYNRRKSEDE